MIGDNNMITYENQEYDQVYFNALQKLTSNEYLLQNDKKILYDTNSYFKFNHVIDAIEVRNEKFVTNYDYEQVRIHGNQVILRELEYYEKNMLQNGLLYRIVEDIKKKPYTKQAIMTMPKSNFYKLPCLMYIYFRVLNGVLYCSAHMRANNAYGLLMMNMHINNSICKYIADAISVKQIYYSHIVDSFHIYKKDFDELKIFMEDRGVNEKMCV